MELNKLPGYCHFLDLPVRGMLLQGNKCVSCDRAENGDFSSFPVDHFVNIIPTQTCVEPPLFNTNQFKIL